MPIRLVPDQVRPSAAIEISLGKPLPDYDLDQMDQPTPRDVDGVLVSQGFRDLVDDARGVLMEILSGSGFEISQLTGAICPGDDEVYRPGLWIVVKQTNGPPSKGVSTDSLARVRSFAEELEKRLNLA